jgi:hypothetical protein
LFNPIARDISRSSGRPMVYGFTPDGRYIVMVYEEMKLTIAHGIL